MKNSTAFILILISIGLFYTFISPEYNKVKALRSSESEYADVISNVEKLVQTRDVLVDKYQTIPKAEIDKLSKILPTNVDTVRLAMDLDAMGSKYGVVIKEVQVANTSDAGAGAVVQPTTGRPYESSRVSLTFTSTYDAFRKFVDDMEANERIANIKDLSFETRDNGLYEYRMTVETYWVK
jgi:Tfp pilus assembly protein PilO